MRVTAKKKTTAKRPTTKQDQKTKYKFSWLESVTNTKTGETSATGLCGMFLVIVPMLLFVLLIVWYFFNMSHFPEVAEILDKLTSLIMIGSGLLGLRKGVSVFTNGSQISIGTAAKKKKKKETESEE